MTEHQQITTICLMAICVILTRAIPFCIFPSKDKTPRFVQFLSQHLASAVFGMLIVYCLKDIESKSFHYVLPQIISIIVCVVLHIWRKNMLLTIAGGTLFYMIYIQSLSKLTL